MMSSKTLFLTTRSVTEITPGNDEVRDSVLPTKPAMHSVNQSQNCGRTNQDLIKANNSEVKEKIKTMTSSSLASARSG
jgi:hypothetical protein